MCVWISHISQMSTYYFSKAEALFVLIFKHASERNIDLQTVTPGHVLGLRKADVQTK